MSRKLQPNQITTNKKRIVYKKPANSSKNFFETFAGLFLINILAIALSMSTAGLGTGVVAGLGFSQFGQAITSTAIQSLVNFSITTTFDAITNNLTKEGILFNFLFSINDIGKFGRALKEDKLIKLLNQSGILKNVGMNNQIKNFHQLQKFLSFKDVILKDKTKLAFKNVVSDAEILQSIFLVSNSVMKKELKQLSYDQLKNLIEIQKIIYQINPRILLKPKKINITTVNKILNNELSIGFDDFLKLNDLEAINAIAKLQLTRVGQTTINNLNQLRMQSKFQQSFFTSFKKNWKNIKNQSKKINPFYWANKFFNEITKPIEDSILKIRQYAVKNFNKLPKIAKQTIKKYNLIPCQEKSFLMAYSFEPITFDGSGYLTIYKKPYVWKTTLRISNYKSVRVWTNISEVEKFAFAESQNRFYKDNWELGKGFNQASLKALNLISSGLAKTYHQIIKFQKQILQVKMILKIGIISFAKTKVIKNSNSFFNNLQNKWIGKTLSIIPGGSIFTSTIIKAIKNKSWNYSWVYQDVSKLGTKKFIKKGKEIKHGQVI